MARLTAGTTATLQSLADTQTVKLPSVSTWNYIESKMYITIQNIGAATLYIERWIDPVATTTTSFALISWSTIENIEIRWYNQIAVVWSDDFIVL